MKEIVKKIVHLYILVLIGYSTNAQVTNDLPDYFPVSPNAASFAKQGLYPVDYFTGKLSVSVPIYTIATKGLRVPISLSYNTSGIQLNETASWVGLGWNLNAGGAIVRNTKGRPDSVLGAQKYWTPIPTLSGSFPFTHENYKALYNMQKGIQDTAPDEYIVSAPGLSGSFYFDQNDSYKAYFRDFQNTKVKIISDTEIEITKDDGTIYKFGKNLQGVESIEVTSNLSDLVQSMGFDFISAWYLTEMIAVNGTEIVSFQYKTIDSIDYSVVASENVVYSSGGTNPFIQGNHPQGEGWNSVKIKKQFLQTIIFPNGKIDFITTLDRQDLGDDYKLNSVAVYSVIDSKNTLIKKSDFIYDYYHRSGGENSPSAITDPLANNQKIQNSKNYALRLKEVINTSNNTKYSFDYNTTPLKRRGTTAQDYWGYMNNNTGSLIPPTTLSVKSTIFANEKDISFGTGNRKADETFMKAGILEKITYPEGGHTVFEYETNRYVKEVKSTITVNKSSGTVMVYSAESGKKECTPSNKEISFTVGPTYIPGSGKITYFFSSAKNEIGPNSFVKWDNTTVYRLNFDPQKMNYPMLSETIPYNLGEGFHTLKAVEYRVGTDGISGCSFISIYASWQEAEGSVTTPTTTYVGGLRVKSIKNYLGEDSLPVTEKKYTYEQESILNEEGMGTFSRRVITMDNTSLARPVCSSSTIYNNNIGGGPSMTYGKVIETEVNPNTLEVNGKTEYYFEKAFAQREVDVFPTVFKHPNYNMMTASPLLSYANSISDFGYYKNDLWNYGSLIETKYYKKGQSSTFKLIKSTNSKYQKLIEKTIPTNVVFNTVDAPYDAANSWGDLNPYDVNKDRYSAQFYYFTGGISLGKKVMTSTIETDYDANEKPTVKKTTSYSYENPVHNQLTKTETTNSKNEVLKTQYFYPQDAQMANEPFVKELIAANRIGAPLSTQTFRRGNKLSEQKTVYDKSIATSNLLLPKYILGNKGTEALNPITDKKISYDLYDDKGNLLQYTPEGAAPTVMVWGYNKTLPVAKIENSIYKNIPAYILDPIQTASSGGNESSLLTALNNLRTNTAGSSLASTYTYKPLVGVSSVRDQTGLLTYYEYDSFNRLKFIKDSELNILQALCYNYKGQIMDCSAKVETLYKNVAISGYFDKSNCPSGQIRNQIYYVTAGKYTSVISQADADAKAAEGLKILGQINADSYQFCYFVNSEIRKDFIKNNCTQGTTSSPVTYTVPARKYSSSVSQADADTQAQTDIDKNGQAYANTTGVCTP